MFDIIYGESETSPAAHALINALASVQATGTIYLGYPILVTAEGTTDVDALLTSKEFGLVAFDLRNSNGRIDNPDYLATVGRRQDEMFAAITSKLLESRELVRGRALALEVNVVTIHHENKYVSDDESTVILPPTGIVQYLKQRTAISDNVFEILNAVIQRTTTLRPKKRRSNVVKQDSKGAILKLIDKEIANLDTWQKKAAIEFPDGPQRIRGLAGSGKTIVLAQKASFLHSKYPDWDIAVTFHTRSLYQQFRNLIRRFSFEFMKDEPDWTKLRVLHSWGSSGSPGIYSEISRAVGHQIRDFTYAKEKFGTERAFEGICSEVLEYAKAGKLTDRLPPLYDVVLIDEAQDLPQQFFELVYHATSKPKRIVYAYDELQNLSDYSMRPATELFGAGEDGRPRVTIRNVESKPKQDIVLPVCYRNSPWTLTTAHALGFGIYRADGLVQMFDDASLWRDIGYESEGGMPRGGQDVTLRRRADASPKFFDRIGAPAAVTVAKFDAAEDQYLWLANEIKKNLEVDELEFDDILVISANPIQIRKAASQIMAALQSVNLRSHLAGVTSSVDTVFLPDSIAITSIYRAKGNEAPMVYVVGADYCASGWNLARKRNIFFTAITRSRGWVQISGVGPAMDVVSEEISKVRENAYTLHFDYPTSTQLESIQRLHRDRTKEEIGELTEDLDALSRLVQRIESGEIALDQIPASRRTLVRRLLNRQ